MVLTFLSEWGALIKWRGRVFGHSIQPPPGFWVRATGRRDMQRVMYSPSVRFFFFFFLPHLPLYWSEWSLERTDWSNRTLEPRGVLSSSQYCSGAAKLSRNTVDLNGSESTNHSICMHTDE